MKWRTAILSISSQHGLTGTEDTSSQVIRELVEEEYGSEVVDYRVVPHQMEDIIAALIEMSDYFKADLILTTGGSGFSPRDVTPEATRKVVEKLAPGISEWIRYRGFMQEADYYSTDRGIAGIRGQSLIVNLPAEPKQVHESLNAILPKLPGMIRVLQQTDRVQDELEPF
ncbi:MogA/MoaB family molybdenum cofactor biosynthesis protein [Marinicrinis sediminis]|uniref:Molybdenum cofactor biosynthesis protein B n=1 Tax=Marinicrinis sediminis TaxID=1652465 RepID=A0ABW5R7U7_9BACL